jgi:hypothetical protein
VAAGTQVGNQGIIYYDADGTAGNEAYIQTDDPGVSGLNDPTSFVVIIPPTSPGGTSLPNASSINYGPGQTRANNAVVPLNSLGALAVFCSQAAGTTGFILDVNGYFQ